MPNNKKHEITLIEGDGIGPEVVRAAVRVIDAVGVPVHWHYAHVGAKAHHHHGELLPKATLDLVRKTKVALKGPITTPIGEGYPSINVRLRKSLDLYACVRPVRSLPGVKALYSNVDIIVFRENTEDLYAGIEHEIIPGVIESIKIITHRASTRIAEYAFQWALREGRKKVTAVHKANIMKMSDGLFLDCCREVSKRYPQIAYNELIVDNVCALLVTNPYQFDTLLMENLYGDILSDLCAGLVGGIGVVPGANYGDEYAVFEAVHGSWPDAAGKDIANPTAMILSAIMMVRHIGEPAAADRIEQALLAVLKEGRVLTGDLGGTATTTQFTDEVMRRLS